ncbi:hypothetical protein GLOTRDRAFT_130848 [Gloeophyllum trabeum ATCC 11539]|uniref:Uncharacterized protein n=1 Tax=Gloeophyllum trabeum (strain ATCC 11539 / FP-39264 / Madison 617) TaxID=670483 RepID=S7RH19_GLOTA|nr:uncharacterized protein GLOTRDRAFT_130848 [Gloeophyllum trabeum ATCC 11539]EPQ53505.1 hypothetical protein GLOTRDRAFT_130848 [Gloeophyllum trabeum ATCC 11539]
MNLGSIFKAFSPSKKSKASPLLEDAGVRKKYRKTTTKGKGKSVTQDSSSAKQRAAPEASLAERAGRLSSTTAEPSKFEFSPGSAPHTPPRPSNAAPRVQSAQQAENRVDAAGPPTSPLKSLTKSAGKSGSARPLLRPKELSPPPKDVFATMADLLESPIVHAGSPPMMPPSSKGHMRLFQPPGGLLKYKIGRQVGSSQAQSPSSRASAAKMSPEGPLMMKPMPVNGAIRNKVQRKESKPYALPQTPATPSTSSRVQIPAIPDGRRSPPSPRTRLGRKGDLPYGHQVFTPLRSEILLSRERALQRKLEMLTDDLDWSSRVLDESSAYAAGTAKRAIPHIRASPDKRSGGEAALPVPKVPKSRKMEERGVQVDTDLTERASYSKAILGREDALKSWVPGQWQRFVHEQRTKAEADGTLKEKTRKIMARVQEQKSKWDVLLDPANSEILYVGAHVPWPLLENPSKLSALYEVAVWEYVLNPFRTDTERLSPAEILQAEREKWVSADWIGTLLPKFDSNAHETLLCLISRLLQILANLAGMTQTQEG